MITTMTMIEGCITLNKLNLHGGGRTFFLNAWWKTHGRLDWSHTVRRAEAQKCLSLPGYDLWGKGTLGMVHAIAGRTEEARRIAGELENQPQLRKLTSALPHISRHSLIFMVRWEIAIRR
jgi:hypothetical protein